MFLPDSISQFPTYSFAYSIPYLIVAIVVTIIGKEWVFKNTPKPFPDKYLKLIISLFILFFGLRWHLFSDSIVYERDYNSISINYGLLANYKDLPSIDVGYLCFMWLFKMTGANYAVFQFFNTIIDFILFYLCIKRYSVNPVITCLFFIAFTGIQTECNLLRNIKVILIFILSLKLIEEHKLGKYILCHIFCSTVHISSLLFIPMYWIINKKWNFRVVFVLSSIAVFIYLFAANALSQFFDDLISMALGVGDVFYKLQLHTQNETENVLSIGTIERIGFLVLVIINYRTIKERSGRDLIFCNMYLIYFFLYAIFGFNFVFRDRIPTLFVASYWFVAPILMVRLRHKIPFLKVSLILLAFLKVYASTRMCSAYYETVLFHKTTIEQRENFNYMLDED